ncbi:MAG: SDR family NAD(P)-dependent oxidoreductase [Acidobacteria bacterium]|nr:SDR family NAD(P)-dependent oxidoreductase [Acidobacteriota bacterium]
MSSSREITGKTVLVTGATSGIGLEAARALARMGALVLVGARDPARGQAVVDEIRVRGGRAELLPVDMASFVSIRAAAGRLLSAHPVLDVLVNNAGMASRRRTLSPDGHELTWATNFLGPFLLTRLLLPALRKAPAARVVNVSSVGHKSGRLEWDNLELERGFATFRAYGNSKLALNLFTRALARREPGISINAVHPGGIATNIWRSAPAAARWILEDDAAAARLWDIAEKATSSS